MIERGRETERQRERRREKRIVNQQTVEMFVHGMELSPIDQRVVNKDSAAQSQLYN